MSIEAGAEPEVTVVIPTIADERRGETIWRAIDSAGEVSGARTRVLVVVNGKRFSQRLLDELKSTPKADCLYVEQGNLPLALKRGREAVRTPFFAFIDDDDEFLPGGLGMRLQVMRGDPGLHFVVSQGWFHTDGHDEPQTSLDAARISADPLGCLMLENWVATSASGLYRTDQIGPQDFDGMPSYLEWTYLGFRLASSHAFRFLDEPTYRRYDVPGSVSKSDNYRRGMVQALERILELPLPLPARRGLRRKLGGAIHDMSAMSLEKGNLREAWQFHLRSLALPGGGRFLAYTRHVLSASLRPTRTT